MPVGLPLQAVAALPLLTASRQRLTEWMAVGAEANEVEEDTAPYGQQHRILTVSPAGLHNEDPPQYRFVFRGSIWSRPRHAFHPPLSRFRDVAMENGTDGTWESIVVAIEQSWQEEQQKRAAEEQQKKEEAKKQAGQGGQQKPAEGGSRHLLSLSLGEEDAQTWQGNTGNPASENSMGDAEFSGQDTAAPAFPPRRKLLRLVRPDPLEATFDAYWRILKDQLRHWDQQTRLQAAGVVSAPDRAQTALGMARPFASGAHGSDTMFSIFVHGKIMALLANKIAILYPNATVVSLVPASAHARLLLQLKHMQYALKMRNHLLMSGELTPARVANMRQTPEIFAIQLIGREVFNQLGRGSVKFVPYLGQVLSLARRTVIELLPPAKLRGIVGSLEGVDLTVVRDRMTGLIRNALAAVGITKFSARILEDSSGEKGDE